MTASALVSGKLIRDPQRKISKSNKAFVSALLKEGDGEGATWWSVLAFNESTIEELSSLKAGDSLAVTGLFKSEIYQKDGEPRISHSLFVDRLVSLKRPKRERRSREAEESQTRQFFDGPSL